MLTQESAPAATSRGAITTCPPAPSIPEGVRDFIGFTMDLVYRHGYRDGYSDAGRAVDAAIAEAAAPLPASAKAVIDSLLRHWNRGTT